tara:strand:+ start:4803 stop:7046 length:2244 start_codon:yes stop_codon:yes gene_type:complete
MADNVVRYVLSIVDKASKSLQKVGKEAEKASKEMGKTQKESKRTEKAFANMAKASAGMAAGIGIASAALVAGVGALTMFAQKSSDIVNTLNDLATRSGMASKSILALQLSFMASGQSAETVQQLVDKMPKLMSELARGIGKSTEAAKKLKVDAFDPLTGSLRKSDDVFADLVTELQKIGNETERATLAADLFGRQAGNMLQAFGQTEGLKTFLSFTEKFGVDTGEKATLQAAQFQQAIAALNIVVDKFGQSFAMVFGEKGFLIPVKFAALSIVGLGALIEDLATNIPSLFSRAFNFVERAIHAFSLTISQTFAKLFSAFGLTDLEQRTAKSIAFFQEKIKALNEEQPKLQITTFSQMEKFGVEFDTLLDKLINTGNKTGTVISKSEDAAKAAKSAFDEAQKQLNRFVSGLDRVADKMASSFESVFVDIVDPINEVIKQVEDRIIGTANALNESVSSIASGDTIGLLGAALEEVAKQFGSSLQAKIIKIIVKLMGAIARLGGVAVQEADELAGKMIERRREKLRSMVESGQISQQQADKMLERQTPQIEQRAAEIAEQQQLGQEQVQENMQNRVRAFALGLKMLPGILLEVLPNILMTFAKEIVLAVLSLPGLIFKALKGLLIAIKEAIWLDREGRKERRRRIASTTGEAIVAPFMASGGRFLGSAAKGMFTGNREGLAYLHRNEFVVPQSGGMPQSVSRAFEGSRSPVNITINSDIIERNAVDELVRRIERQFRLFGTSTSPLFNES